MDRTYQKDLETLTQRYKEQYLAAVKGDESLLNLPVIQAKALDILVSRNLLIQQAEKLGISLSDAQIEQMLAQQPSLQENGTSFHKNYMKIICVRLA